MAPIFTEILFSSSLPLHITLPLSIVTSLVMGFVLVPAAASLFKAHQGYTLYHIGFVAGIVGSLTLTLTQTVAVYKSYGFVPYPVFIWTTGTNLLLGILLGALFVAMAAGAFFLDREALPKMARLLREARASAERLRGAGRHRADAPQHEPDRRHRHRLRGAGGQRPERPDDRRDPHRGRVFGFRQAPEKQRGDHARRVHRRDAEGLERQRPSAVLADWFGTTLAPIAGRFGWRWGVLAGFIHTSVAQSVGQLHGGLVLCNNGFAAGLVAAILLPVIIALQPAQKDSAAPR